MKSVPTMSKFSRYRRELKKMKSMSIMAKLSQNKVVITGSDEVHESTADCSHGLQVQNGLNTGAGEGHELRPVVAIVQQLLKFTTALIPNTFRLAYNYFFSTYHTRNAINWSIVIGLLHMLACYTGYSYRPYQLKMMMMTTMKTVMIK
ncbi:hypothetical protein E2I00_008142 [Balaenoptera physalus]|uniref:Uncharacterized protein n=1 Tax=Balaenoptera physalus TaxID=9770 RepID=A0A643BR61_BALPH|nr:hypothetical protein E2I00_008142 [Balaenoptera physalus]